MQLSSYEITEFPSDFGRLVSFTGATYDEFLKPSVSVLLSNTKAPNAAKLQFATEHGIPVVSPEWLWQCIETVKKVPYGNFLLPDYSLQEARPFARSDSGYKHDIGAVPNDIERGKPLLATETDRPSRERSAYGTTLSRRTSEEKEQEEEKEEEEGEDEEHPVDDTSTNRSHPPANSKMNISEPQRSGSLLLFESKSMNAKTPSISVNSNSQKNLSNSRLAKFNQITNIKDSNSPTNGEKVGHPPADSHNVQDLNASIAELLALKRSNINKNKDINNDKNDRCNNNDNNTTENLSKPLSTSRNTKERRRRGLLGRATSNISNPSNTSRASSNEPGRAAAVVSAEAASNGAKLSPSPDTTSTTLTAAAAAAAAGDRNTSFPEMCEGDMPSQALLYEDPEVQKQREAVIRKIGGRIEGDSERSRTVQGIGVVKDLAAEFEGSNGMADAVGLRVKRRSRQAERDFRDLR